MMKLIGFIALVLSILLLRLIRKIVFIKNFPVNTPVLCSIKKKRLRKDYKAGLLHEFEIKLLKSSREYIYITRVEGNALIFSIQKDGKSFPLYPSCSNILDVANYVKRYFV